MLLTGQSVKNSLWVSSQVDCSFWLRCLKHRLGWQSGSQELKQAIKAAYLGSCQPLNSPDIPGKPHTQGLHLSLIFPPFVIFNQCFHNTIIFFTQQDHKQRQREWSHLKKHLKIHWSDTCKWLRCLQVTLSVSTQGVTQLEEFGGTPRGFDLEGGIPLDECMSRRKFSKFMYNGGSSIGNDDTDRTKV